MPVAAWKQRRDERYVDFQMNVMEAKAIRGRIAAARRAGTGFASWLQILTEKRLGFFLDSLLVAYGFPEGMAAEVGAAFDSLKLQDAGDFDQFASRALNMVDVIDQIELVSHRLKAYACPASKGLLWWLWFIFGGFLSLILHYYFLTPYWAVASWLLSSGVLWSMAIAMGFGRWWAAITITSLFPWLYTIYKDVVLKAMCDDAARLQKGLDQLSNDELLFPESMHAVVQNLRKHGVAVLRKLLAAQRAAERSLSYQGFSAPLIIVRDGGAAAALPPPPDQQGGQQGGVGGAAAALLPPPDQQGGQQGGVGGAAAAPQPPPGHQGGHQGGHQPGGGNSGGGGGRGRAVGGAGSGSGGGGGMVRTSAGGGGVGRNSFPVLTAPGIVSAAAVPATSASQPALLAAEQSPAMRGAVSSSGAATFPTTAAPLSGAAGELGPLTSRSGTTCSNAPSFSAAAGGHATAVLAGSGLASGGAGGGGTHGHARSASVGFLPRGVHGCGSGVGSYVGSDSTRAAAAATHASGASTPLRGRLSGANSPPLTATRLRDAADWSYPGSTLTTPTTQAAAASSVDPWDAGLAMEAALDDGSAPEGLQPAASATAVLQPALPQRQLSGLPSRGPGHQPHHVRAFSGGSASLDPPIAAAAAGGGGGVGGGGKVSRDSSHAALLPAGRSHSSTSSIPAYLEAAAAQQGSDGGAGAAHAHPHLGLVDGEQGVEHAEHAAADPAAAHHSSASSEHGSIEHAAAPLSAPGGLPAWQSPARVSAMSPVPPLPLSRLGSSSSSRVGADFDLAPTTSAAAPAGMQPPAAQRAYSAHGGGSGTASGTASSTASGVSTARRPAGLQQLHTEVLTFETWGLESPDTITPGLQYACQVAQLFVDGRRRSSGALAASMAAAAAAAAGQAGLLSSGSGSVGGSGGTAGPSRLSQVGPGPAASGGAGAVGSSSAAQQQQQAPPWRPPDTNHS